MAFRGAPKKVLVALSLFLSLTVATFGVQAQDGAQASPQVSVQQGVKVKVTPKAVGASIVRWQFAVVFDSHSSPQRGSAQDRNADDCRWSRDQTGCVDGGRAGRAPSRRRA